MLFIYIKPKSQYCFTYSKVSTNFERCSNQFPDTVHLLFKPRFENRGFLFDGQQISKGDLFFLYFPFDEPYIFCKPNGANPFGTTKGFK